LHQIKPPRVGETPRGGGGINVEREKVNVDHTYAMVNPFVYFPQTICQGIIFRK
jgi:hypothetical protein